MANILEDQFLQEKDIKIERSSFLSNHYARKEFALRESYNPRDPFGSRLSQYWGPGDTFWSVAKKKVLNNLHTLLDPDTYSKENYIKFREGIIKHKVEILSYMIVFGTPVFLIYPMLRPRLKKSQTIAKKLETKNVKLSLHEMEEIIKKAEAKSKL